MKKPCVDCKTAEYILTDPREGIVVCTFCGRVQEQNLIEETLESRSFGKEMTSEGLDDTTRVGAANNYLLSDCGLSTVIGRDPKGRSVYPMYCNFSSSSSDVSLLNAFRQIEDLCRFLSVGDLIEQESKSLFQKLSLQTTLRGRSKDLVIAAVVFKACRVHKNPRSLRQVACAAAFEPKYLKRAISFVSKHIKQVDAQDDIVASFAKRISREAGFPFPLQTRASEIGRRAVLSGDLTGRNPMTIASAAVFLVGVANKLYYTPVETISSKSGMKVSTIKISVKILIDCRHKILHGIYSDSEIDKMF